MVLPKKERLEQMNVLLKEANQKLKHKQDELQMVRSRAFDEQCVCSW
jgi:hypothetical protein